MIVWFIFMIFIYFNMLHNSVGGVMISMLILSVVGRRLVSL